mgnify:CR=1 FL=1
MEINKDLMAASSTPIVLAILAFLALEWAVYERDTLVRLRRALGARMRGDRAARRTS